MNYFDLPSYSSKLRKLYKLQLSLMCLESEYLEVILPGEQMTSRGEQLFWEEWGRKLWLTTMWLSVKLCCSDRNTNCCFSNPGSIPTSACWEVMMVRLPDNCPFWKYGFQLFIVQPSHKKKWSLSSMPHDKKLWPKIWFFKRFQEFLCAELLLGGISWFQTSSGAGENELGG